MNMTKAAVLERGRRSTAGTRMSTLVGQAVEDDDTFWNHTTWDDEKGGFGEESDGSFRESDEDEENCKDAFDSDFNDSESDADDDKEGEAKVCGEEEDLRREEKKEEGMKKRGVYKDPSAEKKSLNAMTAGRELLQKRKGVGARKKALKGEGINAGLVLNFPGAPPLARSVAKKLGPIVVPGKSLKPPPPRQGNRSKNLKSTGITKSRGAKRSLRASTITTSIQANAARKAARAVSNTSSNKVRVQRNFTQEELILEALQDTEAENERWILSRKRILDEEHQAELKKKLLGQNASKGKIIRKSYSRRGCYNTITFPDMDHVPQIFTRSQEAKNPTVTIDERKKTNVCIITGQVARYKDPKTMKPYYDLAAFKVLRKRFEAGEPLEGPVEPEICSSINLPISTNESTTFLSKNATASHPPATEGTVKNSLSTKMEGNNLPTNHLLQNDPTMFSLTSSSEAHLTIKTKESDTPTNQLCKEVPSTSKIKKCDAPTNLLIDDGTATSSLGLSSEVELGKLVSPKTYIIGGLKIDSENRMNAKICLNETKLSGKTKLEEVCTQKLSNIAKSNAPGILKNISSERPLDPCQALKAGQENHFVEKIVVKVDTIITSGNMKQESDGTIETDSKVEAIMATVPVASISICGDVKEENDEPNSFNPKVKAMVATLPVVLSSKPAHVKGNSTVAPAKVYVAKYPMDTHSIPKYSNAAKIPINRTPTKRTMSTTSSKGRKKRKPKSVTNNMDNLSAVPSSAYYGDLRAPLTSHLSGVSMAPGFYHPVPNYSNPHLHHLITKPNQMPYGYSHLMHPPPVDMASLYALSLTSPLQTIAAPLPLSIQNQQLHQRGNHLPAMPYPQPSHMPIASENVMGNLMRAYNIVSTADSEQRAKQQQQEYLASKKKENGRR